MKNIRIYDSDKYKSSEYVQVELGVYERSNKYVMSISFEQEPELDEGSSPSYISQYPLEDILDRFRVFISDPYDQENKLSQTTCYLELCGHKLLNIQNLKSILGKHVYNVVDGDYAKLVIE